MQIFGEVDYNRGLSTFFEQEVAAALSISFFDNGTSAAISLRFLI